MPPADFPSQTFSPSGRDPTSIAFLRQPGTERFYSGVTNSNPSEPRLTLRNVSHSPGALTSRSSLNIGTSLISTSSHVIPLGDRAMAAFATLRLKDSRLRLPTTTATDMTIPLVPLLVYL